MGDVIDNRDLPSRGPRTLAGARGEATAKAAAHDREDATESLILP